MPACKCNKCECPVTPPPKGHKLDTQLFPECEDTKYDRDIVKKNRKERKSSFNLRQYRASSKKD